MCQSETLNLSYTAVRDVSSCQYVDVLNLKGCTDVTSVADLRALDIQTQTLQYVKVLQLDQSVIQNLIPHWLAGYDATPTTKNETLFQVMQH